MLRASKVAVSLARGGWLILGLVRTIKNTVMNWEMIGAVGQIIAAVAVIPSVVYLAIQIRNQNKESRRASANVFILHWSDIRKSMSDNADLAAIHLRGLHSFDELDPVSKLRFGSGLGRLFLLSEGLYRFTWMECWLQNYGEPSSVRRLTWRHTPVSELGGLHASTGILTNFAP